MNYKIENTGNFVTVTNTDTSREVKRFNCPVIVEDVESFYGDTKHRFKINGYQVDSSDIVDINGTVASMYGSQKIAMEAIMTNCTCC